MNVLFVSGFRIRLTVEEVPGEEGEYLPPYRIRFNHLSAYFMTRDAHSEGFSRLDAYPLKADLGWKLEVNTDTERLLIHSRVYEIPDGVGFWLFETLKTGEFPSETKNPGIVWERLRENPPYGRVIDQKQLRITLDKETAVGEFCSVRMLQDNELPPLMEEGWKAKLKKLGYSEAKGKAKCRRCSRVIFKSEAVKVVWEPAPPSVSRRYGRQIHVKRYVCLRCQYEALKPAEDDEWSLSRLNQKSELEILRQLMEQNKDLEAMKRLMGVW